MTANDLATQLIRLNGYGDLGPNVLDVTQEAATMLRQQQDKLTKYELRHAEQRKRIEELETLVRQQQAEIEALKDRFSLAFWHDTFVEVKKPNSDLVYRFKLDGTNDS